MVCRRPLLALLALFAFPFMSHCCEAAPPEVPKTEVPRFPVDSYQLANGLKIALSHDPTAPRTTVCVAYHVGSKNERPGLTGFAHFFEHMMFRGTKNVPDFDIPLQQAGGSPNAFTSEDVTVYFETVPNEFVKRALYMEAERMAFLSSALDQDKFDTEREVVKNERRQRMENQPYGLAAETISSLVYPKGHPYSWSVIGSMKDLNSSTLEDLRQFFFEFYHPANATLTLVGGFDPPSAKAWVESLFGPIASGSSVGPIQVPATPAVAQRVVQKDRVQLARVYWAWPTVAESAPDAPALDLLAMILADGDASRLMQKLVIEEQAAVDVDASNETGEIGGVFKLVATVARESTLQTVETLLAEVTADVQESGVLAAEVARVRAKYRTDMLVGLTSPVQRTFVIAMGLAQHNDPHYYQTLFTRYDAVTVDDIQRVAQKYLVDDKIALIVDPIVEGEKESEAVLAGPLPDASQRTPLKLRQHQPGPEWSKMPDATESQPFSPPAFQRSKLSNGLEVWLASYRTLPLISTQLLVRSGTSDDTAETAGLAQLTSELWDQGTETMTSTELAEAIDDLGTSLSVSAGINTTQLSFTVESRSFDAMIELIGDMVTAPRFAQEDFDREQKLQLSDLASGPDSGSWLAGRVFPTLLFGMQHPYALPGDGYTSTVKKLAVEQVRKFYASHFTPNDSILIVVGDYDPTQVTELLEEQFGSWKGDASPAKRAKAAPTSEPETVYLVDQPGSVQSVIAVGRTWKDRSDDSYFATRVGNRIFGGDFLSRINQNLRQRNGFTYGARSGFRFYEQGSNWNLTTSVRSEVTGAALREIANELRDARTDRPLTEDEVSVARSAETSVFPQSFETPASIASSLSQLAIYHLPDDYYQTYLQNLQTIDPAAAAKAMADIATSQQIRLLVVGDAKVVTPTLREAGFSKIVLLDSDGRPKTDGQ